MLEPTTRSEKCSNEKRKEIEEDKMLQSEVKWFPHFLDQCKQSLSFPCFAMHGPRSHEARRGMHLLQTSLGHRERLQGDRFHV